MESNTLSYEAQATQFLADTKTDIKIEFLYTGKHFDDDKEDRDIFKITLSNSRGNMVFNFGNSIVNREHWTVPNVYAGHAGRPTGNKANNGMMGGIYHFYDKVEATKWAYNINHNTAYTHIKRVPPTAYSILACLTKYAPSTFDNFCSDFGYDTDSRRAFKIYEAVLQEWSDLNRIFFSNQLELMAEIQ